ncbi:FtsW/RodA/SpoVE family cell cycle protein [Fibrobacterota bacterium]
MRKHSLPHLKFDSLFLMGVLALVGIGIVIIYSSSGAYAESRGHPDTFYLFHHLKKVVLAFAALILGMLVDFQTWKKLARPAVFIVMGFLVFLITAKGISDIHGAKRWISFAGFGLQPSELAKIAVVFFLANFLTEKQDVIRHFRKGLLASLIIVGIISSLVLLQPDYSTAAIILCISIALIFAGGARLTHLLLLGVAGAPLLLWLMISSTYRFKRVMAFLSPGEHTASSYQSMQAMISLGNGGITGTGLGTSTQKLGYLPMPFTDSIFSILGEELGMLGTMTCLLLFALIIWRGLKVAFNCEDRFGSLIAVGVIISISVNVIMHVGVCAGFFPTTGQPLPFVSYGGSALCSIMFLSGVLLNISGNLAEKPDNLRENTRKIVQRAWAKQKLRTG